MPTVEALFSDAFDFFFMIWLSRAWFLARLPRLFRLSREQSFLFHVAGA
jgi:hypothetical protein